MMKDLQLYSWAQHTAVCIKSTALLLGCGPWCVWIDPRSQDHEIFRGRVPQKADVKIIVFNNFKKQLLPVRRIYLSSFMIRYDVK